MKSILFFALGLLAYVSAAFSQIQTSSLTIDFCFMREAVTPNVPKPQGVVVARITCSQLILEWDKQYVWEQDPILHHYRLAPASYKIIHSYLDPITREEKVFTSNITPDYCGETRCAFRIDVPKARGATVNWSIQTKYDTCNVRYVIIVKPGDPPKSEILCGDERKYLSYPVRGSNYIPFCQQATVKNSVQEKQSIPAATEEMIKGETEEKVKGEIYPNPVQSVLNVNYTSTSKNNNIIKVFDVNGRIVISKQATPGTTQVNVSKLSSGLYSLRIENSTGKSLYSARFIKE